MRMENENLKKEGEVLREKAEEASKESIRAIRLIVRPSFEPLSCSHFACRLLQEKWTAEESRWQETRTVDLHRLRDTNVPPFRLSGPPFHDRKARVLIEGPGGVRALAEDGDPQAEGEREHAGGREEEGRGEMPGSGGAPDSGRRLSPPQRRRMPQGTRQVPARAIAKDDLRAGKRRSLFLGLRLLAHFQKLGAMLDFVRYLASRGLVDVQARLWFHKIKSLSSYEIQEVTSTLFPMPPLQPPYLSASGS